MIYIDELKNMKMYKRKFRLSINEKDKRKGSAVILLTPDIDGSINTINHPLIINKYHKGYYIERNIMYFVNNENTIIKNANELDVINENSIISDNLKIDISKTLNSDYVLTENSLIVNTDNGSMINVFGDTDDIESISEGSVMHNNALRKILYNERLRRPKEVFEIYDKIKEKCPRIDRTHINYKRYRSFNLFVDFYYYNETFFKNNMYRRDRGIQLYFDFITRFFNDKRLSSNGYDNKMVIVPVNEWKRVIGDVKIGKYTSTINPISIINRLIRTDVEKLRKEWGDIPFLFIGNQGYFKVDFSNITKKNLIKFMTFINRLQDDSYIVSDKEDFMNDVEKDESAEDIAKDIEAGKLEPKESKKSIVDNIVSKIEVNSNVKINNLTGTGKESKDEIVNRINNAASSSKDSDEAIKKLDEDDDFKKMVLDISNIETSNDNISVSRKKRITELKDQYLNIKVKDKTVEDILTEVKPDDPIPEIKIEVDSINEDWESLKAINFESIYNVEEDLLKIMDSFSDDNKRNPVPVRDIKVEDTSTSEDYISTYTFSLEDMNGKRYQLKLDIPEFVDDKFLMLKGNKKAISRQLLLLPVVKTGKDTVQVVSNYNKLMLVRFGSKLYHMSDRLIKLLEKIENTHPSIRIVNGDCTRANSHFTLPIDYMELGENYITINTRNYIFLFNQKDIMSKYKDMYKEKKDSFPFAYDKKNKKLIYCNYSDTVSEKIKNMILDQYSDLADIYNKINPSRRYSFTRVKILNNNVPLIVVLSYTEGLFTVLKKSNISFELHEKRPKFDKDTHDIIRFKDSYLVYKLDYSSSLLMNGLKMCNTEDYEISDMNNKSVYLDFLDLFGGRIMADGLDNFYELMIDPITEEVLKRLNLPTDFVKLLIYANSLLSDNGFSEHVDMSQVRFRSNEIVSAAIYKVLSKAYGQYKTELKRGRKDVKMSIKQSAVLDEILTMNIVSDVSDLTPVLEAETLNSVSTKGPSGLNEERAYGLDKRAYHSSMLNIIGMSTPQGPGVGVNRQTTIDKNIDTKRGYLKLIDDVDEFSVAKTLTVSEALAPFGSTRDDPPRTSMNLSQAKHTMRVHESDPLLITNGIEEVLPYILSNTFSFKSKQAGEVIDKTEEYLVIKYKDNTTEFIDLRTQIKKNSSSGFYVPVKLDSNVKVGDKVKENEIVAYDKVSYSDKVGHTDNIAATSGTFVKFAVLNTEDGFEDSAIISQRVSKKMASDVVIKKEVTLGKNANILNIVKKGDPVQEGDSLLVFQNSYDEEDVNALLRNLVDDQEVISDLGRIPVKSKYTGVIEDVKAYRTVDKSELSSSIKKEINNIEKSTKELQKIMKKYNVEYANRFSEVGQKLDPTGKLKNTRDGVLFEFYIKYEDRMAVGDKLTFFIALKGIVKDIFPEGDEPYTDFRPDEKMDALLAIGSINARMTTSIIINMLINKILIELSRSVKDILGIKYDVNE